MVAWGRKGSRKVENLLLPRSLRGMNLRKQRIGRVLGLSLIQAIPDWRCNLIYNLSILQFDASISLFSGPELRPGYLCDLKPAVHLDKGIRCSQYGMD